MAALSALTLSAPTMAAELPADVNTAVDRRAALSTAATSDFSDDIVDLRGDWHFAVYRKYSNMFQYLPLGRSTVTWEDQDVAKLPDASQFSQWETVSVPAADYSTGGLMQMVRPGHTQGGARDELSSADLFPNWSEGWFARAVEIPRGFLDGRDHVTLMLGIIDDMDVVYINGTPVAASGFLDADGAQAPAANVPERGGFEQSGDFRFEKSYWEVPREYEVDASLLREGANEISIRVYNNNSYGGFYDREIALVNSELAVRALKDLPTERLTADAPYRSIVDAQVAAIESEDLDAYAATLDEGYHQNEIDKAERLAALQKMFDTYDNISVTDSAAGFYQYRGSPVYSAERIISAVSGGQTVQITADALHLQYFVDRDGKTLERGNLSHIYAVDYVSTLPGMNGNTLRYNIYLPPTYYTEPDRVYPVVYLLHGINSTGDSFVNVDRVQDRMDEWIASGSVDEMIVVMPNSGKNSGYADTPGGPSDTQGPWASHIHVDILDQIDSHYRTIAEASYRGLTGISMGGGGVFKIGMAHTDLYTSFASHMGAIPDLEANYSSVLESDILPTLDFYIDHGNDDQLVSPSVSQRAADYLNRIGANLVFELRDGGHNSAFYMEGMQASMAMHSAHFLDIPTPTGAIVAVKTATLDDANGNGVADEGEQIQYDIVLTNTGNLPLSDVSAIDPMVAGLTPRSVATLAPSASATFTAAPYTVTASDVIRGMIVNVATGTGTTPGGAKVTSPEASVSTPTTAADDDPEEEPVSPLPPDGTAPDGTAPDGGAPGGDLADTGSTPPWALGSVATILLIAGAVTLYIVRRNRAMSA